MQDDLPTGGNNVIDLAGERRRRGPRFDGGLMDILEVSRDMVCMCRAGAISAINGAGTRLLGASCASDVLGQRFSSFIVPEYGPMIDLFMAGKASADKPVPTRLKGMDGNLREVEMQIFRAREIAADATIIMCRDVGAADGKPARADAAAAPAFPHLIENAMNLVCHVHNGRIVYINRAGQALLGADSAESVIGRDLAQLFTADYADLFAADTFSELLDEPEDIPMRLVHASGEPVDVYVAISPLPSPSGSVEVMIEARDVTAHNKAVRALRRSNEMLEMRVAERTRELGEQRTRAEELRQIADASRRFSESLLDMLPNPVWFRDLRGAFQSCNRAFRDLFGCDPSKTPDAARIVEGAMPAECQETDRQILAGTLERAVFEGQIPGAGGARHDALITKCAFPDEEGRSVGVLAMLTDITERKAMERELRRLATVDPLTGAFNRRHFMAESNHELDRAARYGNPLSLVMLDIDHFKKVNDTHGHAIGDEALKVLVTTAEAVLRDVDVLGRLGGEEFAVMLPETGADGAMEAAERLREAIAQIRVPLPDGGMLSFTASLGIAVRENDDIEHMLARADTALYRAKQNGRNRVERG